MPGDKGALTCSNTRTHTNAYAHPARFQNIIAKDGIQGLLFRGLGTKIISNGAQGLLFNVLWRYGMDLMEAQKKA